jgi:hypothetical protein
LKILARLIFEFLRLIFRSKEGIVLENLALRQRLAVQQRSINRPKIKNTDRIFWVWLSRIWSDWRTSLIIVKVGSRDLTQIRMKKAVRKLDERSKELYD